MFTLQVNCSPILKKGQAMTNLPIPSISKDGKNVRTAGTLEEPLFLAKDVVEGVGAAWKGEQTIAHVPTDFRVTSDVTHPKQGVVKAWYLNELGLYFYLNRSDSPLALPWQIKVAETLRAIRQQTFSTSPDLEARLEIAEAKLQIFEEHCPAKFYDFDEVAALMHFYVKPPFGRNHLKRWLIDRKILCTQAFKNDKPIQSYIDRGWFVAVIHEWFRRGKKHSENRFYMTPRGVMGVIDMAIREKLLTLPAPKQACLPGLYRGA